MTRDAPHHPEAPRTEVRIGLPSHLQTLAGVGAEVSVAVAGSMPTLRDALDALEAAHPVLRGTVRAHGSDVRRPYIRLFACRRDLSHDPPETPLPEDVVTGRERLEVVGAISGG